MGEQVKGMVRASTKHVYDLGEVESAIRRASEIRADQVPALMPLYRKMMMSGGDRFAVKPADLPAMDVLYDEMPNFSEPLDDIRRSLALCVDSNDPIEMSPMLLLGDPGIGKTHFARKVAALFGTGFSMIPMSSQTAGWVLSGASSQWKNAKPGKVFETFLHGEYANPVFLVDEIDKASSDRQYDPLGALYSLLEQDTARRFTDEFVEVPIDVTAAIWMATANDESSIPDPILSRMTVYEIKAPTQDQAINIASILYAEIRRSHDWGKDFPEQCDTSVLELFASISPREIRREMLAAFGNAKIDGRYAIRCSDVQAQAGRRNRRQPIGFVA
jgi:ATP-dependent Lon protease